MTVLLRPGRGCVGRRSSATVMVWVMVWVPRAEMRWLRSAVFAWVPRRYGVHLGAPEECREGADV